MSVHACVRVWISVWVCECFTYAFQLGSSSLYMCVSVCVRNYNLGGMWARLFPCCCCCCWLHRIVGGCLILLPSYSSSSFVCYSFFDCFAFDADFDFTVAATKYLPLIARTLKHIHTLVQHSYCNKNNNNNATSLQHARWIGALLLLFLCCPVTLRLAVRCVVTLSRSFTSANVESFCATEFS